MKRVAITGVAGFIGSNLAERLLARGDRTLPLRGGASTAASPAQVVTKQSLGLAGLVTLSSFYRAYQVSAVKSLGAGAA
jgi:nucleoside-diphosphate-sugar epimerase